MIEKNEIIKRSSALFKQSGIRSNTMDDIASSVGISKKTLYQHFHDKNELIKLVIEQEYFRINNELLLIKQNSKDGIEELIKYNLLIIMFLRTINPVAISELHKLYQPLKEEWSAKFRNLLSQAIFESIKKGKQEKIIREDINELMILDIHTEKLDQLQQKSSFWDPNEDSQKLFKEMISYYIRGLVTEKGEQTLNKYINDFNTLINDTPNG